MSTHKLNRLCTGPEDCIETFITPSCSCGWIGTAIDEEHPWCITLILKQEKDHIRDTGGIDAKN